MAERRLCGIDINGIRDSVARNWTVASDGDVQFNDVNINDGGTFSSIVRTEIDKKPLLVGGAQADLAPHGRGGGWGLIGSPENRTTVRHEMIKDKIDPKQIAAAIRGMVVNPSHAIMAIDDCLATTDARLEAFIEAFRINRTRNYLLVWRPVLIALKEISDGRMSSNESIAIICHSASGLTLQTLKIKEFKENNKTILAPERKKLGFSILSNFGYSNLEKIAISNIENFISGKKSPDFEHSKSIGNLSLGLPVNNEILRNEFDSWYELECPKKLELDVLEFTESDEVIVEFLNKFENCKNIIFETHTAGRVKATISQFIEELLGREITVKSETTVAEGALAAAKRLANDEPIYFDFLPQISTIVKSADGAKNFNLIDQSETLRAGKFFRSKRARVLGLPAYEEKAIIHLNKQLEVKSRKAEITIPNPPSKTVPIDIWVEQTPALGQAKILMSANQIGFQTSIDWNNAEEQKLTWLEIIKQLDQPMATVPNRLIVPYKTDKWEEYATGHNLSEYIDQQHRSESIDWDFLSNKITRAISSDGELPPEVTQRTTDQLSDLSKAALDHLDQRRHRKIKAKNGSLKFLTWQFKRCPEVLVHQLIDIWEGGKKPKVKHPFAYHPASWVLILQGIGRITNSVEVEKRIIDSLMRTEVENWNYREETACISFLLSRSDSAPTLLTREHIEKLASRVEIEFASNLGTEYTKFNYAPFLLVGLLRFRLVEPGALVIGSEPLADKFEVLINEALPDLERQKRRDPFNVGRYTKYSELLSDVLDELAGEGGNPNLLLDIYNAA